MTTSASASRTVPKDSRRNARPLVLPETFSGEADLAEWIDHFESVAAVNEWDDTGKLQWLRVRLTGRAFKRFPEDAKTSFGAAKTALKERFDPESRRKLHIVEFQTRKKSRTESWADFGEDLRIPTACGGGCSWCCRWEA
jgi:hypothetical protein